MLNDSIYVEPPSIISIDLMPQRPAKPQTPYQVLRLLPKDATPAQQDSAVQAWFQPGEIHYSERPDTLHLPGQSAGHSLTDVDIPQYYRESYFSNDTLYHPELDGGRLGVAGDPIPYSIRNDNIITSLLLSSFVISIMAYSASRNYFLRQIKDFFYPVRSVKNFSETAGELRAQLFFLLQTCMLLAMIGFFYTQEYIANTYIVSDEYLLVAIYFGVIVAYFAIKAGAYAAVNTVFFDSKRNEQWQHTTLFLNGVEGILLFPAVMTIAYFDISSTFIYYYLVGVLVFVKLLTFYKCFVIFFKQNELYLQIILYFCTLEITPLLALWGAIGVVANALKVNF